MKINIPFQIGNKKYLSVKDKHTLEIFNNENLIGIIDLIEEYPNKDEWIIGLMLIHPDERGHGVGEKVHKILIDIAKKDKRKNYE